MSPMFHLEGTNEVNSLKDPTTVFLNGDHPAVDPFEAPIESQQTEEGHLQEAPLEDKNFNTDPSLFGDNLESYRDGGNENDDNGNMAYAAEETDQHTAQPYNENQTSEEEDSEPSRTMVDYNNYDSNYISNAGVQGLPTLSSLLTSRLRAGNTLNSLGLKHSALGMPYYASLVKQIINNKARGVKNAFKFDPDVTSETAAKKDNATTHSLSKAADEDAKKQEQEYKKNVQNAEMAANLAEAAKTLTKLVKKLTEHDAMISRKQEEALTEHKNNSGGLLILDVCRLTRF